MTKEAIESDFARNRDEIDNQFREEKAALEQERAEAHAANSDRRLKQYADLGLDTEGNSLDNQREKPEYFNRHRVTSEKDAESEQAA